MAGYKDILRKLPELNKAIAELATEDPYPRKPGPKLRAVNAAVWTTVGISFWWVIFGPPSGMSIPAGLLAIVAVIVLWSRFYKKQVDALHQPRTAAEKRAIDAHDFAKIAKEKWSGKRLRRSMDPAVAAMLELIATAYYNLRTVLDAQGFTSIREGSVFEEARLHALSAAKDAMAEALLIAKPYFGSRQSRTKSKFTSALESLSQGDLEEAMDDFVSGLISAAGEASQGTSAAVRRHLDGMPNEIRARIAAEQELAEFVGASVASRKTEPEIVALNNILAQMQKLYTEVQVMRLTTSGQRLVDDSAAARLERAISNLEQIRIAEEEIHTGL